MNYLLVEKPRNKSLHVLRVLPLDLDLVHKFVSKYGLHLLPLLQGKRVWAPLFERGFDRLIQTLHPVSLRQCIRYQLVLLFQLVDRILPLLGVHRLPLQLDLEVADRLLLLFH